LGALAFLWSTTQTESAPRMPTEVTPANLVAFHA
jgi:hypothetical protein